MGSIILVVAVTILWDAKRSCVACVTNAIRIDHMHTSRCAWCSCVVACLQVPELWKGVSYPSLRPLGSYLSDLYKRLDMLAGWAAAGRPPAVFWLPGFFFVQSFLTAGETFLVFQIFKFARLARGIAIAQQQDNGHKQCATLPVQRCSILVICKAMWIL